MYKPNINNMFFYPHFIFTHISTFSLRYSTSTKITPLIVYNNSDTDKSKILRENRNKSCIYCWINNLNSKVYVGSTVNLAARLYKYYSVSYLLRTKTHIGNALLKYGYSNFRLEILEFCEKNNLLTREQYYMDALKPEYNILVKAGSTLGFRHTQETLDFFRKDRRVSDETRENLSLAATGRVLTQEERNKISESNTGLIRSKETRRRISESRAALYGVRIEVTNSKTKEVLQFPSIASAATKLKVSRTAINKAISNGRLLKGKYSITTKN